MQTLGEAQLLALWERGLARHPIDRALLLCAWARPDMPLSQLPDLPLGTVNRALLRLRETCFGSRISAFVDCEQCGEPMEISLDIRQLLADDGEMEAATEFQIAHLRFRVPTSRDLAAISGELDIETAAVRLLEKCCLTHPRNVDESFANILAEAEAAMEAIDTAADINLALTCEDCGHNWLSDFNIGALLWEEMDARARALLAEVHSLARAYGWTEPEILALSPQRRAAYLEMAGA
jgi:hypothetical protein